MMKLKIVVMGATGKTGQPIVEELLHAEQWCDMLIGQAGRPEFLAEHLYQVAIDHQDGIFNHQTDAVENLTGVAPRYPEDFVREHLALFKGDEAVFLGV
jgi:NAD(P)H dehydrogenase (quinone)